jgi:hypothetical protein
MNCAVGFSAFAGAIGLLTVLSWAFGGLRLLPGMDPSLPKVAIAFIVAATSLWLLVKTSSRLGERVAHGLALLVLFGGVAGLAGFF